MSIFQKKHPNTIVAEVLGKFARECAETPLGQEALRAVGEAVQERGGLGFIPDQRRMAPPEHQRPQLSPSDFPIGILFDLPPRPTSPERTHYQPPPQQQERRRGPSMPFARDFSGGARSRPAANTSRRQTGGSNGGARNGNGAGHAANPFAGDWSKQPPPPTQERPDQEVRAAYTKLGLAFGTKIEDVKKRRRNLAKKHHGDVANGNDRKMAEINHAVDVIEAWMDGR